MKRGEIRGQYSRFTLSDFISDPFFQDWVIHPEGEAASFWEDWVKRHPENAELIREARTLLESIHFVEQFPSDKQVEQSLASARERIAEGRGRVVALPLNGQRGRIRRIGWAAAVIAVIGI